jgi:hypothetical protein
MAYGTCFLCGRNGTTDPLDEHHIFFGWANRRISDGYNVTVPLCHDRCHENGPKAAHKCRETNEMLKRYGQRKLMLEQGWTVDEFRAVMGKNWLDEDELEEIYAIQRGELTPESYEGGFEAVEIDEELPEWLCA